MQQDSSVEFVFIEPPDHGFDFVLVLSFVDVGPVLEGEVLEVVVPVEGVSEFVAGQIAPVKPV